MAEESESPMPLYHRTTMVYLPMIATLDRTKRDDRLNRNCKVIDDVLELAKLPNLHHADKLVVHHQALVPPWPIVVQYNLHIKPVDISSYQKLVDHPSRSWRLSR